MAFVLLTCLPGFRASGERHETMLFDTHAHFFSNDVARYPIDTAGAREGADELRKRVLTAPSTAEIILKSWDGLHVEGGAGVQYNSTYKTDNRYLMDVCDSHPDRIGAVVILDPQSTDTPALLRKFVTERGVTGIRMTGFPDSTGHYSYLESEAALNVWAEADKLGIAVVLMYLPGRRPSEAALTRIGELAARFPRLPVVLDHIGWPAAEGSPDFGLGAAHHALAASENVYFKLTTINLNVLDAAGIPSDQFLRHVVDLYGADRLMWGSDFGNTKGEFADMVRRANAATGLLTDEERRKVLHDTGKRLFARRN